MYPINRKNTRIWQVKFLIKLETVLISNICCLFSSHKNKKNSQINERKMTEINTIIILLVLINISMFFLVGVFLFYLFTFLFYKADSEIYMLMIFKERQEQQPWYKCAILHVIRFIIMEWSDQHISHHFSSVGHHFFYLTVLIDFTYTRKTESLFFPYSVHLNKSKGCTDWKNVLKKSSKKEWDHWSEEGQQW